MTRDWFSDLNDRVAKGLATPFAATVSLDPEVLGRLKRWRDVGDGSISYCAGGTDFAEDVTRLITAFDAAQPTTSVETEVADLQPPPDCDEFSYRKGWTDGYNAAISTQERSQRRGEAAHD